MIVAWPTPAAAVLVAANRVARIREAQLDGRELTLGPAGWTADYLPTGPERYLVEATANGRSLNRRTA
jgi:hypothetical protein